MSGHDGSMCNADQYGSMGDQILSIDLKCFSIKIIVDQCRSIWINSSQFFSMLFNADQRWIRGCLIRIERHWIPLNFIDPHWSTLISIDWHWYLFGLIHIELHWSAKISIDPHWSALDIYLSPGLYLRFIIIIHNHS